MENRLTVAIAQRRVHAIVYNNNRACLFRIETFAIYQKPDLYADCIDTHSHSHSQLAARSSHIARNALVSQSTIAIVLSRVCAGESNDRKKTVLRKHFSTLSP